MKRNILIISFSALLIFAFASADNAVSPLVNIFHSFYNVSMPTVLYLISSCTLGIVVGTFIGPVLIANHNPNKLLILAVGLLAISTLLFILTSQFMLAILWRAMFGFFSGILASILWWLTFQHTQGKTSDAMVVVLMTARPVALCLGVPLAGFIAEHTKWQTSFAFFLVLIIIAGIGLISSIKIKKEEVGRKTTSLVQEYINVFKLPYSSRFYFGIMLNAIAYFGFYAFAGIWFIKHYDLNLIQISTMFLFIGAGEILISFIAPWIYRVLNYKKVFTTTCLLSLISFGLFINAQFSLKVVLSFIIIFIMLNRIFLFALIRNIPVIFEDHGNKATLGSLITLSMWLGFALVSWIQARFLPIVGITVIQNALFVFLVLSLIISFFTQKKCVFPKINTIK